MRTSSSPFLRLRVRLALGTALGSFAALPAVAQNQPPAMPTQNDATIRVTEQGVGPTFSTADGGTRLNVNLLARNTVIDWNGFNIPEQHRIHFQGPGANIAVLNRDVSPTSPSQLLGDLTSSSNVAVWVFNPNGILVGSRAAFNTGSLVLTTLEPDADAFSNNRSTYRLTGDAASAAGITVQSGAELRVSGGNRGLVLVAPKIDANGDFTATGQDAAFVTASDVSLSYSSGSPLSITLHRGTAVGGTSQLVRGSVNGNNAIFALASQSTVTDALLKVDASVTTASVGSRGIVLSAGTAVWNGSGVTIDATVPENTSGVASIEATGDLTVEDDDGSQLRAGATGTSRFTGNLTSNGAIRLESLGNLQVAGAVEAADEYRIAGGGVVLGGATTSTVVQRAGGRIEVASTNGDILGQGALELRSGGSSAIELTTSGTTAGDIRLGADADLVAGNNRSGDVNFRIRDTANVISGGNIAADDIQGNVGGGPLTNGLALTGTITLGNVDLRGAIDFSGAAVTTGSLASDASVTLNAAGAITTGGIIARNGAVLADGAGALTIGGDVNTSGALTLRGASIRFDGASATSGRAIDLLARSGGISSAGAFNLASTSANSADFVRLQAGGPEGIAFGTGSAITAGANRALRVGLFTAANAPLALGNVTARSLGMLSALDGNAAQAGGAIVSSGSLAFGNLNLVDRFAAESTLGNLTVGQIAVTGNNQGISLRAANGTLTVQNQISASGDVSLASLSALQLDSVESFDGAASIVSGGAVTLDRLAGARGAEAQGTTLAIGTLAGGSGAVSAVATSGDATFNAVSGGAIDISATGGTLRLATLDATGATALTGGNGVFGTGGVRTTGGALTVTSAGGAVELTGGARSNGDLTITGTRLALGGEHRALGAYQATATAGAIAGAQGLSITADADGSGNDALRLSATGGGVLLGSAGLRAGQNGESAIVLASDGADVRFGDADGASLAITGATSITAGNLTLGSGVALAASGAISTGAITAGSDVVLTANGVSTGAIAAGPGRVTVDAGTGALATGAITAAGAVALQGTTLDFGQIEGGSLRAVASSGNVRGGGITADGGVSITASQGAVTLGQIRADNGNVAIEARGPMELGGIVAGGTATLATSAAGAGITLVDGLQATGSVSVTSGGDILGPSIRSFAGDLTVAAPNGRIAGFGGSRMALQAGPGRALSLTVGTDAELGDIVANEISITARSLTVGSIDSRGEAIALRATAGDLNVLGVLRGSTVRADATGATRLGAIEATGAVTLAGGTSLSFGDVSGASVAATSGGALTAGAITTGGSLSLVSGAALSFSTLSGGAVTVRSGGTIDGNMIDSANTIDVNGTGAVQLGALDAVGGVELVSGGNLTFGALSGASVVANSNGTLSAAALVSPGAVTLNGGTGLSFDTISGSAVAASSGGTIQGNAIVATGTLGVDGLGEVRLGSLAADGAVMLNGGTGLSFADLTGGSLLARSGGGISGGPIVTRGAVDIAGQALNFGDIAAGAGLTLAATGGAADLGGLTAAGRIAVSASGLARVRGAVVAGSDYRVTGASVVLGEGAVEQRANGAIQITATQGDITGAAGLRLVSDGDANAETDGIILDAAGGIALGDSVLRARPGGGAALGIRAGSGRTISLGAIEAGRIGGFDGTAVTAGIAHDADFTAGDIVASTVGLALSNGNIAIGDLTASGAVSLRAAQGSLSTGDVTAAALTLGANGALATGAITASDDATLEGERIAINGRLAAARQLLMRARQALSLGDVASGGAMTIEAGGALTAGRLDSGGALALTSGGDLTLGGGTATGAIRIDAAGLARLGALTGSPSIDIRANDAELSGAVRAGSVTFVNRRDAQGAMRIGDATAEDGFRLSNAEVALVAADRLRFDAGAGALQIGTLDLGSGAGTTVDMLGTADVRVTGVLRSDNFARSIRIGGNAEGTTDATALHVVATSDAGGRLLVDGADLDLRAGRIAVGLATGFIDTLAAGAEGVEQANALITNPNSALYNALLGGGFYSPEATTTVAARSLSMRISDYALFQNSAVPGQISGVQIGSTQTPVLPALSIGVAGLAQSPSFAMFGTVNGIGDATAALLGAPVFDIDPRILPNSRINGCPAGSGVGCLTTIIIQPTLQVFRWDSDVIFGISSDVAVPFSPNVSGNNEELLSGLPSLLPEQPADRPEGE